MIHRIAARIAALSQPLSERYDYGTAPEDSLSRGEEPERCEKCGLEHSEHSLCDPQDFR
jgi:DTW domain-containing protein YfiP